MHAAILALALVSLAISLIATALIKRLAVRLDFVDKPGHRKIHDNPKPLGGGIAIYLAIALPMLGGLLYANLADPPDIAGIGEALARYWADIRHQTPLAVGLLVAITCLHILGVIDDKRALGPYLKLIIQLAVIAVLVVGFDLRALTVLGPVPSSILTILWIAGITNAFNFLDNMDGLSAGVAIICGGALLVTTVWIEQWFVAGMLAIFLGAVLGFLFYNFSPASIFMGDSGSMLIGLVLGVLSIRTQYLPADMPLERAWYSVLAPVVLLAVPLYDMLMVSIIRIGRGKSPFVGDTNHLSHRLVARGMSRRTAVLCIYLMTAATSIAAIILPHVRPALAGFIFAQTVLVLGLVALLEQHPVKPQE